MRLRMREFERKIEIPERRVAHFIAKEGMSRTEALEFCRILKGGRFSQTALTSLLKRNDVKLNGSPGRKSKIHMLPSTILKEIKEMRLKYNFGYRHIASRITRRWGSEGWFISSNLVYRIFRDYNIDGLIKEAEEREEQEKREVDTIIEEISNFYKTINSKWENEVHFEESFEGGTIVYGLREFEIYSDWAERQLIENLKKRPVKHLVRAYLKCRNRYIRIALLEKVSRRRIEELEVHDIPIKFKVTFVKK